jgi:hypothetical protein
VVVECNDVSSNMVRHKILPIIGRVYSADFTSTILCELGLECDVSSNMVRHKILPKVAIILYHRNLSIIEHASRLVPGSVAEG